MYDKSDTDMDDIYSKKKLNNRKRSKLDLNEKKKQENENTLHCCQGGLREL